MLDFTRRPKYTTRSANISCEVLGVESMRLTSLFRMTRFKSVVESVRAYW